MTTETTTFRERLRGKSGFTLIELLLVLVILGILAGIVYPSVINRRRQAEIAAAKTQIVAIRNALGIFETDNGYFPKSQNALLELVNKPGNAANWHGPYLEELPKDPWGNAYVYLIPGNPPW